MKRREVISTLALAALAGPRVLSADLNHVEYTREAFDQALASGNPLMLDFYASW